MKKSESLLSLFCHEQPERITDGCSFVKSNGSELLKSLFKKEQMSEELRERFALGHKKMKHCKKMNFSSDLLICCKRFSHVTLL